MIDIGELLFLRRVSSIVSIVSLGYGLFPQGLQFGYDGFYLIQQFIIKENILC